MRRKLLTLIILFGLLPSAYVLGQGGEQETGTINDDTPFYRYTITVDEDGETIVADIQPTAGDLDTLLYLLDSSETIVDQNDDRSDDDTSSLLEYPQANAGTYTLIATRYKVDEGKSSGDFALEVGLEQPTALEPMGITEDDLIATGFPPLDPQPEAEWTILVYYGGDNNLERGILNDLNEFEIGGGSSPDVKVVAMVDRGPGFAETNGDWQTVRIFEMGADVSGDQPNTYPAETVATIDTPALADLGELDTGDRQTFAQFLIWTIQQYPAQHYAVAFGSHGAAWKGLIQDDTSDRDLLTIPELQEAFTLAINNTAIDGFDLLINDACLMSSVEYFAGVAPYFDYALASAEVVVDPALDMASLVELLGAGESVTDVGSQLVDFYMERDVFRQDAADAGYLTSAVTDLDAFDPVVVAVENFARIVNRRPAVYSTLLGDARAGTYTYTSFMGRNKNIDLGSFMARVIMLSKDEDLIDAAEAVLAALNEARLHGEAGEIVEPYTSYYNIFFPDTSEDFKIEYLEQSPLKQWGQMLRNYYNAVTPQVWVVGGLGFHIPAAPQVRITSIYPSGPINVLSQVEMNLEIIGRRIAYGDFTIDQPQDDGSTRRLYVQRLVDPSGVAENLIRPGVSNSTFNWDVTLPVISDGVHSNTELLTFTESVAFLDGRYRESPDAPWRDVGVVFDINDNFTAGTTQRIINRAPESDALAVISIPPGSEFQAYSSVRTPDGRVIAEANETITYLWPEGGLTWKALPAPGGDYDLGLLMTAFGGTTGFTSTSVTVNNDAVDLDLLGALWTDLYFRLAHPADWSRLNWSPDGSLLMLSTNEAGTEGIYVIFITGLPEGLTGDADDLTLIADKFEEDYGVPLTDRDEIEVNGTPALDVGYSYETEAGVFQGRGFVVFNPWLGSKGVGMLVSGEALEGMGDLDATYTLLRDNFTLIDALLLTETDIRDWKTNEDLLIDDETRYPVRLSWLPGFEVGDWLRYAPRADETSPTFAAMRHIHGAADAEALLDQQLEETVMVGAAEFTVTGEPIMYGQTYVWSVEDVVYLGGGHTWHAILYTAERDGQPVIGRLYATIYNGDGYAVWVETPNDDTAPEVFKNTFEPLLDGFLIGTAQNQAAE